MGPDSVEVFAPAFDDYLSFFEGIKDLTVQELVFQPGIKLSQ